jgi:hypothetical protein
VTYRSDDDPTITDGRVIEGELVEPPLPGDELTERLEALSREIDDQQPAELGPQLTTTLRSLAAEAGIPSVDLEHNVRAGARRARRRRLAVTGITALAVLTFSATAVTARSWGSDETDRLVAAAPPTSEASPTSEPILAPPLVLPSARVTPSATPSPAVSGVTVSRAPGSASAPPAGSPAGAPAPAPAKPGKTTKPRPPAAPLTVAVQPGDTTAQAGREVTFVFRWSDGDGRFGGTSADWGDASPGSGGDAVVERCNQVPSPRSGTTSLSHVFDRPGTYTVTLRLSTYVCNTYAPEERTLTRTVTVTAPPEQTPPPSPSVTPSAGVA